MLVCSGPKRANFSAWIVHQGGANEEFREPSKFEAIADPPQSVVRVAKDAYVATSLSRNLKRPPELLNGTRNCRGYPALQWC